MKRKEFSKKKGEAVEAKAFDAMFDRGEDVTAHLDTARAVRRVNVDFPVWEIEALDLEADRLGITRQALVKVWIAERLDNLQRAKAG